MSADTLGFIPCSALRILVTDDETPVRDIFRMILSLSFPTCQIDVASNGQEAVDSFQQFHQGVLLMDLKMPVMDGQTAFDKIREHCTAMGWEMPAVIFCTGFTTTLSVKSRVDQDPRHCVIQKPVTSEIICTAVRSRLPALTGTGSKAPS
ncbi:MAG: response regulator [Kiritimatiellia bacterium]